MTRPSKFAPEFKARAIDLYRSSDGRTIADVARSWDGYRDVSHSYALAESFFVSLKTELIYRHTLTSRHDAELAIFARIETSHQRRCQAAIVLAEPKARSCR